MKTIFILGIALLIIPSWLGVFNSAWIIGWALITFSAIRMATHGR